MALYFFKNADGLFVLGPTSDTIRPANMFSLEPSADRLSVIISDGDHIQYESVVTQINKDAIGTKYTNFSDLYTATKDFFLKVVGLTTAETDALYNKIADNVDPIATGLIYSADNVDTLLRSTLHRIAGINVDKTSTGTTSSVTVHTMVIPANSIGANGEFHIIGRSFSVGSGGTKYCSINLNGVQVGKSQMSTSQLSDSWYFTIVNKNSLTNQVGNHTSDGTSVRFGTYSQVISNYTFNTAVDVTVTLIVTLTNAADVAGFSNVLIMGVN